jgi:ligand-binding sensor domain-containing protein
VDANPATLEIARNHSAGYEEINFLEANALTYGDPGDGVYCIPLEGKPWKLQGLSHPSVLSVFMDREGSLWVGLDGGGLNRVKSQVFGVVDFSEGSTVQSVSEAPDGGMWIAYNGDRIDHWKGGVQQQFTNLLGRLSPQQEIAARSVLVDKTGIILAGIQTRPSQRATGERTTMPFPLNESVVPGLLKLSDQQFIPTPGFEVANQQVSAIFQDRRGWIWVGTKGGAASFDGKSWRTWTTFDGLSGNAVQAIAQDSSGRIWLGTDRGGLNCLQEGRVTVYTKTNGLPSLARRFCNTSI